MQQQLGSSKCPHLQYFFQLHSKLVYKHMKQQLRAVLTLVGSVCTHSFILLLASLPKDRMNLRKTPVGPSHIYSEFTFCPWVKGQDLKLLHLICTSCSQIFENFFPTHFFHPFFLQGFQIASPSS